MKKAVFVLGTLSKFARRGDVISAEDFRILAKVADHARVDAEIVFAVTDMACAGRPKKASMKLVRAERDRMIEEINKHEPDLIMAFGPVALKALFDKGNLALREQLREGHDIDGLNATVYVTHSLDQVAAKPGMEKWLVLDTKAAVEGFTKTEWGEYDILDPGDPSWHVCPDSFRTLARGDLVGFDLETYPGLDPWHPDARIRMAVLSTEEHKATIVQLGPDSKLPQWLEDLVIHQGIIKCGSNIKFDYKWLRRFGVRMRGMHDTSTAEHILDETNPMKDLKSLTFLYAPWLGDYSKGHRALVAERGGWEYIEDDEMYDYTGGDGEASICAADGQAVLLSERKLTRPFRLSMDLYRVLAEVEHNCCYVDMSMNEHLDDRFQEHVHALRTQITEALGPINPGSPKQLASALKDAIPSIDLTKRDLARVFDPRWAPKAEEEEETTTNKATLEREASKHPIIETILVWRRLTTLYGTYIKNVREKYLINRRGNPCLSTSFRTDVTETCRLSSQAPNLQNIPRKPSEEDDHPIPLELNVKKQYISRFKGGKILEADLSQAELRLAAMQSQDPLMLAAINSGEDVHKTMASMLLDKPREEITKDERQRCKAITFLMLYGGGANTLSKKLGISKERAKDLLRQYFITFDKLDLYIQRIKARVHRDLEVTSPFGYKRRFKAPPRWDCWEGWRIERQAFNFMIQNPAACCVFVAMIDLQDLMEERGLRSKIVLQVHDSLGIDCHPDEVDEVARLAKQCLENPDTQRYGVEITVPLVADVEVGDNWGDKEAYQFSGGK